MRVGFFLEKWVNVGRYCQNKGRSVSLLSKNGWLWVVFLEKWVGVGRIFRKIGGSVLFSLKNGWGWVRVAGSG